MQAIIRLSNLILHLVLYMCSLKMFLPPPFFWSYANSGFSGGTSGKEPNCQCRRHKKHGFSPWVGKIPWRREQLPTPVFLLGEFHGQRSLVGYCPWGRRVRQDQRDLACMHAQLLLIPQGPNQTQVV